MLGKLIRYDFKAVQRLLFPVYGAMIVLSVVIGLTSRSDSGSGYTVFQISMMLFMMIVLAAILLTIYLLVERFYHNLLGNEGYLMFALPVSTSEHIIAKILTALIWMAMGCLAVLVCGIIMGLFSMTWEDLMNMFRGIGSLFTQYQFSGDTFTQLMEMLLIAALTAVSVVVKVYASISIGHLWSSHRILGSVFAYVGFTIAALLVTTQIAEVMKMQSMWSMIAYLAVWIAVYGLITWYILDRRLNLE